MSELKLGDKVVIEAVVTALRLDQRDAVGVDIKIMKRRSTHVVVEPMSPPDSSIDIRTLADIEAAAVARHVAANYYPQVIAFVDPPFSSRFTGVGPWAAVIDAMPAFMKSLSDNYHGYERAIDSVIDRIRQCVAACDGVEDPKPEEVLRRRREPESWRRTQAWAVLCADGSIHTCHIPNQSLPELHSGPIVPARALRFDCMTCGPHRIAELFER